MRGGAGRRVPFPAPGYHTAERPVTSGTSFSEEGGLGPGDVTGSFPIQLTVKVHPVNLLVNSVFGHFDFFKFFFENHNEYFPNA